MWSPRLAHVQPIGILERCRRARGTPHAAMLALNPLLASVLAFAAPALAQKPPHEISASYDLARNGVPVAVVHERFSINDGAFEITSETHAVGLFALAQRRPVRFASRGHVNERGLQPERFEAGRGADDPRRVAADFNWREARLTIRHDGREETLPLAAGTQDRLSIMYQFMFLELDQLTSFEFSMTNGRRLGQYHYAVHPGVEIDTVFGRIATVHLARQRNPDDRGTEVWLSPAHGHLAVKVMVAENDGARYEQTLTRLNVRY